MDEAEVQDMRRVGEHLAIHSPTAIRELLEYATNDDTVSEEDFTVLLNIVCGYVHERSPFPEDLWEKYGPSAREEGNA